MGPPRPEVDIELAHPGNFRTIDAGRTADFRRPRARRRSPARGRPGQELPLRTAAAPAAGHRGRFPGGAPGRDLRPARPQRRRQDHDHQLHPRPLPRRHGQRHHLRRRPPRSALAAAGGLPAGAALFLRPPDGGRAAALLRPPAGPGRRRAGKPHRDGAGQGGHGEPGRRAAAGHVQGHAAAPGPGPGHPRRSGPADPRRAHERARSHRPPGRARTAARAARTGQDHRPVQPHRAGHRDAGRQGGHPAGRPPGADLHPGRGDRRRILHGRRRRAGPDAGPLARLAARGRAGPRGRPRAHPRRRRRAAARDPRVLSVETCGSGLEDLFVSLHQGREVVQ
jgi:hypothetical protein